jgi:hypothetical protein
MLKIGSVKWRGRCAKHPKYDPAEGGLGAVRGNCIRCNQLVDIYDQHQKLLRLMRTFQPIQEKKKTRSLPPLNEFQESLFT